MQIAISTSGLNERIDANTEIMVYRIIQESVNNTLKHSGASKLDIGFVGFGPWLSKAVAEGRLQTYEYSNVVMTYRLQAGALRSFAAELFSAGVPVVITIPPLPLDVGARVVAAIAETAPAAAASDPVSLVSRCQIAIGDDGFESPADFGVPASDMGPLRDFQQTRLCL